MSGVARCQSCGAGMLWAKVAGAPLPLDPEERVARRGLVAYNAATGGGVIVAEQHGPEVLAGWAKGGVTFHSMHHSSCAGVGRHRVPRAQAALW